MITLTRKGCFLVILMGMESMFFMIASYDGIFKFVISTDLRKSTQQIGESSKLITKNDTIGDSNVFDDCYKSSNIHQNLCYFRKERCNNLMATKRIESFNFSGLLFAHPASSFSLTNGTLKSFLWNDSIDYELVGENKRMAIVHFNNMMKVGYVAQSSDGITLLPAWGKYMPNAVTSYKGWPQYSTALLQNRSICYWPKNPTNNASRSSPPNEDIHAGYWEALAGRKGIKHLRKVMISGEFVDNFWHSMTALNTWCEYKDESDLYFLIQSNRDSSPPWVQSFSAALGISNRVVYHDMPIFAEQVLTTDFPNALGHLRMDWSCLHKHFANNHIEKDYAIIILRRGHPQRRDIPESIHNLLVDAVSEALPSLKVITFVGNETFKDVVQMFRGAKIVIGPHGAAMTNLIFSQKGTPVVEYLTPDIFRPWLFYGGATIGMKWWPVLLSSFDAESEILNSVEMIKEAVKESSV